VAGPRRLLRVGVLALVPLGSTEQHGPHLPEGTDHVIAEAFARAAADETGFLCTPTVNVGVSGHHRQFHGTMWVSPSAFRNYVESLTRNLTSHGIDRVVFVNAHGGNVPTSARSGATPRGRSGLRRRLDVGRERPGTGRRPVRPERPHGGPKETAMLQYLEPELVHDDRLAEARDGGVPSVADAETIVHGARTYYDAADNTENGVLGDQTDATPAKGEQLFEAASDQLVQLCEWLDDQRFADLMPRDHV